MQTLKEIVQGIRYVMQTQNQYSFAMTGPTSLAFETAVCNTLEAEDKIMVMVDGCIGQRVARISKAYGFGLIRLQVRNPGELVEKEGIKRIIIFFSILFFIFLGVNANQKSCV